jgi:hypothetical protein
MKLYGAKKTYYDEMHTSGPEATGDNIEAKLEIRTASADGKGFYCVINATEIAFDTYSEVDAFAQRIKDFMLEFC